MIKLKYFLFSSIVFLCFFASLELGLRTHLCFKYKTTGFFKPHVSPEARKEGYFGKVPKQKEIKISWKPNSLGLRGPEIRSKQGTRICCFGGSSTFGAYLEDDETYPYYLGELLGAEVINCGVPGMQMEGIYELFKEKVIPLEPDIITVYSAYNDAWRPKLISKGNLLWRIHKLLWYRWMLYTIALEKYSILKSNTSYPYFELSRNFSQVYARYLRLLVSEAKSEGIEVVLIRQVVRNECTDYFKFPALTYFYRYLAQMEEIGEEYSLLVVRPDLTADKFFDLIHLTAEGNRELAEIITEAMNE